MGGGGGGATAIHIICFVCPPILLALHCFTTAKYYLNTSPKLQELNGAKILGVTKHAVTSKSSKYGIQKNIKLLIIHNNKAFAHKLRGY